MQGEWLRQPTTDGVVIFVHGILSSGATAWTNDEGRSWPELIRDEPALQSLGIYLFSYETGLFSGSYRISDAVDALKEHMRTDNALNCKNLFFVCHSMGGIVARKFILELSLEFKANQKNLCLFLVASPSLGAFYANWLKPLAKLFGHSQAAALGFVRNNDWLASLDKEFTNLKESGHLSLKGKELVEDKFITLKSLWRRQIVEPFAGAKYFGEPFKVPLSDHFSIAKPKNRSSIQHKLLCKFILDNLEINSPDSSRELLPIASKSALTENQGNGDQSTESVLSPAPNLPDDTIVMPSLFAVDERTITSLLEKYGSDWPEIEIAWPPAANALLSSIDRAVRDFDNREVASAGGEYFIEHAPSAIDTVSKDRPFVRRNLPSMVKRLAKFRRENLTVAVRNFLLISNYQMLRSLIYLSSWQGLRELGVYVPPAFNRLRTDDTDAAYGALLNERASVYHGRLTGIGATPINHTTGYVYLYAPKHVLVGYNIVVSSEYAICAWLAPQFELLAPQLSAQPMPETYLQEWNFSVVKNSRGREIKASGEEAV